MLIPLILLAVTAGSNPGLHATYDAIESKRMVPLLMEILAFPTVAGNQAAHKAQREWLMRTCLDMGFTCRDAGLVFEIDLPGPAGAPVLGLVVHGDVTAVDERSWSSPPFQPTLKDGMITARGAADDKGPLVAALLAMKVLASSNTPRTHTVRLLVGSDEESDNTDIDAYLQSHAPPALSLVLDSVFPVVVGEKAWNSLTVTTSTAVRSTGSQWSVSSLEAGVATSIVPDRAECLLAWETGAPSWDALVTKLKGRALPEGTSLELQVEGRVLRILVRGRSAHAGVNLEGGRNALVALALLLDGLLPVSGPADLLAFAIQAGTDSHGSGLGITDSDPLWGRYAINVATIKPVDGGDLALTINLRRIPPRTGAQLREHLDRVVAGFNAAHGASLRPTGWYDDEPFFVNPESRLVRRLLGIYQRATGERAPPAISGGGTYAKRLPRAIAFGMWFPGSPYPGHDADERVPVADLHRGVHVLLEALLELALSPPITDPMSP